MSEVKDIAELEGLMKQNVKDVREWVEKAQNEVKEASKMSTETKAAVEKLCLEGQKIGERIQELEQKLAKKQKEEVEEKSIGQVFLESDSFKNLKNGNSRAASVSFEKSLIDEMEAKTAMINARGLNQPLVPQMRVPGIVRPVDRRLRIRDVLRVGRTSSNLIQYVKEDVFTNNAAPQYSAGSSPNPQFENVAKAESALTFTLADTPVVTLAHWIPASEQILADAPMLQSYIEGRLMYGLKLEEEDEILNGDGTAGTLRGLIIQSTAYNRPVVATDNKMDLIRKGKLQAALSEYGANAVILNPIDWDDIEGLKDSEGRYLIGNPQSTTGPTLWGLPVVVTQAMASGKFLVGAFDQAAELFDRQQANIAVSREHADFFIKNMVAIRAEERVALAVYRSAALIYGSL